MSRDRARFMPVNRRPLSLLISGSIREAIVSGKLEVGSELPTEKELTEDFQVSRSTVREALRILQAQGLVCGGDTVSTTPLKVSADLITSSASEALDSAMRLKQVPRHDLMELRALLESGAVTSDVIDPAIVKEARAALDVMRTAGIELDAFHDAHVNFHISLASVGGNAAFRLVMTALRDVTADSLREALAASDDPSATLAQVVHEHAAILDAVVHHRHRKAAALIQKHIWEFNTNRVTPDE